MQYSASIRWIHLFLALFMIVQLAVGELMDVPGGEEHAQAAVSLVTPAFAHEGHVRAAQAEDEGLFDVHEWLGLSIVALLLLRWLLAATATAGGNWRILFPWLSSEGRKELVDDIRSEPKMWMKGELPEPSDHDAIAKTVHGAMILTATGLALTGLALYFGWNEHGAQTALMDMVGEVHESLTGLMWALIGGHVFMALLHQKMGHAILQKMRPFGSS